MRRALFSIFSLEEDNASYQTFQTETFTVLSSTSWMSARVNSMDDALIAILFVCMICICFIVIGKMNFDFINIKVTQQFDIFSPDDNPMFVLFPPWEAKTREARVQNFTDQRQTKWCHWSRRCWNICLIKTRRMVFINRDLKLCWTWLPETSNNRFWREWWWSWHINLLSFC